MQFNKIDTYIEIVGSSNPRINAMSRDSQLSMHAVLSKLYTHVGITIVDTMSDLEALVAKKPDLVVLGMKLVLLDPTKEYDDSPKIWLSTYLEEHGISYTGSDTAALNLEFDKHDAKQSVIDAGLRSASFFIANIGSALQAHTLAFPLFVKPTNRGDSKGIDEFSVVYNNTDLEAKVRSIHSELSSNALIEEYLPGREFSVAVIRQPGTDNLTAMPIEIVAPADHKGHSFLSEAVKEADVEKVIGVHDTGLRSKLNALAIGVFQALGSRDYGRIDMRLDAQGEPSFIEANLMPGLSDHGYLIRCFMLNRNIAYDEMIATIVQLAAERTHALSLEEPHMTLGWA